MLPVYIGQPPDAVPVPVTILGAPVIMGILPVPVSRGPSSFVGNSVDGTSEASGSAGSSVGSGSGSSVGSGSGVSVGLALSGPMGTQVEKSGQAVSYKSFSKVGASLTLPALRFTLIPTSAPS